MGKIHFTFQFKPKSFKIGSLPPEVSKSCKLNLLLSFFGKLDRIPPMCVSRGLLSNYLPNLPSPQCNEITWLASPTLVHTRTRVLTFLTPTNPHGQARQRQETSRTLVLPALRQQRQRTHGDFFAISHLRHIGDNNWLSYAVHPNFKTWEHLIF